MISINTKEQTEIFEQADGGSLEILIQRFKNSVSLAKFEILTQRFENPCLAEFEYTWGFCHHDRSCFLYGVLEIPAEKYDELVSKSGGICKSDLVLLKEPSISCEDVEAIVKDSIKRKGESDDRS